MTKLSSGTGGTFQPTEVHLIGEVFDEVWASLSSDVGKDPVDIEFARNHLALIVLDLAKDGQFSPLQITRTATRLMRERYVVK